MRERAILDFLWVSGVNLSRVPYMHHIAVLDDVIFTFEPKGSFGAGVRLGASFEQLIPTDGFSPDEVFFQIGVNRPSRFLGARMGGNLPGAALILAGREE